MTEIKNRHLSEQGEIDRAKIEGYSLRSGAFYSWLKESGYTTSQIATRLDMEEQEFVHKLKTKQLFGREQLRVLDGCVVGVFRDVFPDLRVSQTDLL